MPITNFDIKSGALDAANAGAQQGIKAVYDKRAAQDAADARLAELIKGAALKRDEQAAERSADLQDIKSLRGLLGKDAKINAGHITIDPREYANGPVPLTKGQEAADTAFGKDYATYQAGGGKAGAEKSIQQLESAAKNLPDPNALQRAAGILPKSVRDIIMPESAAKEDEVRGAVQSVLRQTLGPQFTEREGEQVMSRAYNPRLPKAENIKRVMAEARRQRQQAEDKDRSARYFEQHGTLTGGQMSTGGPATGVQGGTGLEHLSDQELRDMASKLGIK